MKIKDNTFYHKKTLSPKERVELDNLRAENEALKKQIGEQSDALIELAEIITEEE